MVTDARGHNVPDGSDTWGSKEDWANLSLSISDVRAVADHAAGEAAVQDLLLSGLDPTGTVWWLASPGALFAHDGATWIQLAAQSALDDATKTTDDALARLPYVTATGVSSFTNVGGNNPNRAKTITFAAGMFSRTPTLVANIRSSYAATRNASCSAASATSFQLNCGSSANSVSDYKCEWIAIQQAGPASLSAAPAAADAVVTCPTDGCANAGVPIPIAATWTDDDGTTHQVDAVECGVCGADLTDTLREA